ncbi:L-dopachrome tautomerase-related protein [Paenibacillus chondroitinus]|uniref:L-dopachrome tautomerase-related protein n=1 Tax=Paenibacillus chondroitinus TaxID=59842 RepID=A0ABU6DDW1_9BACL|nr:MULTISPECIES: L-dopachrome tautomerase-related protein [Paenibacillus]MCY9662178.1 major royal jelly family protein [Paenibacillus anseongense]MEB4795691.1 L-dopachrome tautomerase-related protein [Paenibacillus chondroitinus]
MYKIICHWSRLDWHFPQTVMKEEFETKQIWKKAIPASVKVDHQGQYYVSVPRWSPDIPATMNRIVVKEDKPLLEAFPSWAWNEVGDITTLQSVLGFEIDEYNRMWLLDQGKIAFEPSPEGSQKLLIWDLNSNSLVDAIDIPDEIAPYRTSFLNDLVVDNKNGFVYITDSGCGFPDHPLRGGIIVYNMKTKTFRRVLDGQFSTQDFPDFHFQIDYKPVFKNKPLRIGVGGIALSGDRSTLYYCQLTGRNLYAVHTKLLRNEQIPLEQINSSVQVLGSKGTTTDGMHADNRGNLFYTMLEGKGIGFFDARDRSFHKFVSDDRMLWVDGVAFDQKGSIIFNNNRLHEMIEDHEIDWNNPYNLIIWKAYVGKDVKSYLYG